MATNIVTRKLNDAAITQLGSFQAGDLVLVEREGTAHSMEGQAIIDAVADEQTSPTLTVSLGRGRKIAVAGDSIAARALHDGSTADDAYGASQGFTNWARALSGGAFVTKVEDNVAIGGSNTATLINTQLPDLLTRFAAGGIGHVVVSIGTNDADGVATFETITGRIVSFAQSCIANGAVPVFMVPPPRTYSGAVANFYPRLQRLAEYIAEQLPVDVPGAVSFGAWSSMYIPATGLADDGSAQTHRFQDGTHFSARGAYEAGRQLAAILQAGVSPRLSSHLTPKAIYDATDNPKGPLVDPFFSAKTAYSGGDANITGNMPNGWSIERTTGSQTIAVDVANITKDGQTISATTLAITAGGVAGSTRIYRSITPASSLAGVPVILRARIRVVNAVNLRMIELRNRRDTLTPTSQSTFDMYRHTNGAVNYMWPDGSYDMYLETPPMTIPDPIGTNTLIPSLNIGIELSGSVTVHVLSMELVPA